MNIIDNENGDIQQGIQNIRTNREFSLFSDDDLAIKLIDEDFQSQPKQSLEDWMNDFNNQLKKINENIHINGKTYVDPSIENDVEEFNNIPKENVIKIESTEKQNFFLNKKRKKEKTVLRKKQKEKILNADDEQIGAYLQFKKNGYSNLSDYPNQESIEKDFDQSFEENNQNKSLLCGFGDLPNFSKEEKTPSDDSILLDNIFLLKQDIGTTDKINMNIFQENKIKNEEKVKEKKNLFSVKQCQSYEHHKRKEGRRKKDIIYQEKELHGAKEMGNTTIKMLILCIEYFHVFFWNFIQSIIGDKHKNIEIQINKNNMFVAKLTKMDKDNKPEITQINLDSPNISNLFKGPGKEKPIDPNNEYHIDSVIKRFQLFFKEKIISLYLNNVLPKRIKEDALLKKTIADEDLRKAKKKEIYQKLMKELITTLLTIEENEKEKPITALLNLQFIDILKIFINYDKEENPEKIILLDQNLYGIKSIPLVNFEVYEKSKNQFSEIEKDQNHYRDHMIKLIDGKIKTKKKNK